MNSFVPTPDQEQWFRANFFDASLSDIKDHLCCSISTIYRLAQAMGLKRRPQRGNKIYLTDEQKQHLIEHFSDTKNEELAQSLGISVRSVVRFARSFGLSKTREFMIAAQAGAAKAAQMYYKIHGSPIPKGYHIPGSEKNYFRPGETLSDRIGEDRAREVSRRSAESRRATLRRERARVAFGLPQKTRLRVVRQPEDKRNLRYALRKKGYHLDDERHIAFYDAATHRSEYYESKPQRWYTFAPSTMPEESSVGLVTSPTCQGYGSVQ